MLSQISQNIGTIEYYLPRSVGCTGKFLDDLEFEALDVHLYLHPGIAPPAVIDTYYTFPGTQQFGDAGWHGLGLAQRGCHSYAAPRCI